MPTEYCLYDFDGDGASTGVEIRVSDASATIEDAEHNLTRLESGLQFAKAHLDQLLADKNAAQLSLNVREAKAVADVAIEVTSAATEESLGHNVNPCRELGYDHDSDCYRSGRQYRSLGPTAGLEAISTAYDTAEEASELVAHIGELKDPIDKVQAIIHTVDPAAEDVIQATNH